MRTRAPAYYLADIGQSAFSFAAYAPSPKDHAQQGLMANKTLCGRFTKGAIQENGKPVSYDLLGIFCCKRCRAAIMKATL